MGPPHEHRKNRNAVDLSLIVGNTAVFHTDRFCIQFSTWRKPVLVKLIPMKAVSRFYRQISFHGNVFSFFSPAIVGECTAVLEAARQCRSGICQLKWARSWSYPLRRTPPWLRDRPVNSGSTPILNRICSKIKNICNYLHTRVLYHL